jgi:hypothetical protein
MKNAHAVHGPTSVMESSRSNVTRENRVRRHSSQTTARRESHRILPEGACRLGHCKEPDNELPNESR